MTPSCFPDLSARLSAFEQADLYPVITSDYCAGRSVETVFEAAARGGAKLIQVREKHCSDRKFFEIARHCREIANFYHVLLIIDDRLDIALAVNADGVHIGQEDLPVNAARRIAPELLIGTSTHNLEEIAYAQADGVSYLNVGPIFPTQTKAVGYPALGLDYLREAIPHIHIPFTVMGGIKEHHIADLVHSGARRIAMVTEITTAPDIEEKVRQLRRYFPGS